MSVSSEDGGLHEFGPVCMKFERPDILHVEITGQVELPHISAAFDAMDEAFRTERLYILREARHSGAPSRPAREFLIKDRRVQRVTALVCYGAPFPVRVVIAMVDTALRLLRPNSPHLVFVATYEEGRAWIESDRAQHLKAAA